MILISCRAMDGAWNTKNVIHVNTFKHIIRHNTHLINLISCQLNLVSVSGTYSRLDISINNLTCYHAPNYTAGNKPTHTGPDGGAGASQRVTSLNHMLAAYQ